MTPGEEAPAYGEIELDDSGPTPALNKKRTKSKAMLEQEANPQRPLGEVEWGAAEVALGARWEHDDTLGVPKAAEYDVPAATGNTDALGTNLRDELGFHQSERLREQGGSQLSSDDYTKTGTERGHLVGQENSAAGGPAEFLSPETNAQLHRDVARDLMEMTNIVAQRGEGAARRQPVDRARRRGGDPGAARQHPRHAGSSRQRLPPRADRVRVRQPAGDGRRQGGHAGAGPGHDRLQDLQGARDGDGHGPPQGDPGHQPGRRGRAEH